MKKGKMPINLLLLFVTVLLLINLTSVNADTVYSHQIYLPLVAKGTEPTLPDPNILPRGATVDFNIFRGKITGSGRVDHINGDDVPVYADPDKIFVIAFVDVENLDFSSNSVSVFDLQLRDSGGRLFDLAEIEVLWAAEEEYDKTGVFTDIQPGFIEKQVYAFEVPLNASGLELVASDSAPPGTPIPNPIPTSIIKRWVAGVFGNWQYTVTNVFTTTTLNGENGSITAKGVFLVIFATVINLDTEPNYIWPDDFVIQDSVTRQFDMADEEAQYAAEYQYNKAGVYDYIDPLCLEYHVYVFDILPYASGLLFVPTSPGDAVNLSQ